MIQKINFHIDKLNCIKTYPKDLFFIGNLELLNKTTIAIVGSRSPNQYARALTHKISSSLSQLGISIISGGALGVDTIAHQAAGASSTVMIAGTGLDKRYPSINEKMIQDIEQYGLILSQFKEGMPSFPRNFAIRNELIIGLADAVIVAYADKNSGTSRSIDYALKMKKKIYVLPHRIGESEATNELLEKGQAKAIYDVDRFVSTFSVIHTKDGVVDEFLKYCTTNPTYDNAMQLHATKVFEYELLGKIKIENGTIFIP